jgi:hypothetical protein
VSHPPGLVDSLQAAADSATSVASAHRIRGCSMMILLVE